MVVVRDGPNGKWEGGQYRRIEACNRALSAPASSNEFPENGKIVPERTRIAPFARDGCGEALAPGIIIDAFIEQLLR
jgi:hypothetical protein